MTGSVHFESNQAPFCSILLCLPIPLAPSRLQIAVQKHDSFSNFSQSLLRPTKWQLPLLFLIHD